VRGLEAGPVLGRDRSAATEIEGEGSMTAFQDQADHVTQMIHMNVDALWFTLKARGGNQYLDRLAGSTEVLDPDGPEARHLAADADTLAMLADELRSLRARVVIAKKPAAKSVTGLPDHPHSKSWRTKLRAAE
jgi:hypothetical protein